MSAFDASASHGDESTGDETIQTKRRSAKTDTSSRKKEEKGKNSKKKRCKSECQTRDGFYVTL